MWSDDDGDVHLDWGPKLLLHHLRGYGTYGPVYVSTWTGETHSATSLVDTPPSCVKMLRRQDLGMPATTGAATSSTSSAETASTYSAVVRELMLGGLACTMRRDVLAFSDGSLGMELVNPACTLHDLHMGGKLPLPVIAELGRQLLTRVEELHEKRIVHGCICPRSIVVTWNTEPLVSSGGRGNRCGLVWPELHLIDFGLSRARALCSTAPLVEQLRTRAPEVHMGNAPCTASDVWAVGAIMWYWATGCHLVTRPNADEAFGELCARLGGTSDAAAPSAELDAVDADVRDVLLAALRMDAAARATTAQLLAMRLFTSDLTTATDCGGACTATPGSRTGGSAVGPIDAAPTEARSWLARRQKWWATPDVTESFNGRPPCAQYLLRYDVLLRVTKDEAMAAEAAYVASGKALTSVTADQIALVALASRAVDLQPPLQCLAAVLLDRLMAVVASGPDAIPALTAHDSNEERALVAAALFLVGACYAPHGPLALGDVLTAAGCCNPSQTADAMRAVHLLMCASKFRLLSPAAFATLRTQAAWRRFAALR